MKQFCQRPWDGGAAPGPLVHGDTQASSARARATVIELERAFGFDPADREYKKLGYDIESRATGTGRAALHRSEGACDRR